MVSDAVEIIIGFLRTYPHVAYIAVFLLALSESIPVIGAIVPGSAIIIGLSALVPGGVLMLWPLLAAATLGAIVGDGVAFWLGRSHRDTVLQSRWLRRYPAVIDKTRAFFDKHGDKSVFLARFVPGVRAFVPMMGGVMGMSRLRFYTANIASAIVWAPSHILPGVLAGAAFSSYGRAAAKPLAILAVIIVVGAWLSYHAIRFVLRRGIPLLEAGAEHLRQWGAKRTSLPRRMIDTLFAAQRNEAIVVLTLMAVVVSGLWLFLSLLEDMATGDPLVQADQAVFQLLQDLHTIPANKVMVFITELGDPVVVIALAAVVFLWLVAHRAWRTAAYWLTAVAGSSLLNTVIKIVLHRPRPNVDLYTGPAAFSFPSGHSTVNMVLYGFLAFLIARRLRPPLRLPVALCAVAMVLSIAFSRLYLGAHWFSDVASGLAFGSAWLALLGLVYLRKPTERKVGPYGLIAVFALTLALVGGGHVWRSHNSDLARYTVKRAMPLMAEARWWSAGWQQLADWRTDIKGEQEEPLNIQWGGHLHDLEPILLENGWQTPPVWNLGNTLVWIAGPQPYSALPVIPSFSSGRLAALTLFKPGPDDHTRLVLRMWRMDADLIGEPPTPLWAGSVVMERMARPLSLITLSIDQEDVIAPLAVLKDVLHDKRLIYRTQDAPGRGTVVLAQPKGQPHGQK